MFAMHSDGDTSIFFIVLYLGFYRFSCKFLKQKYHVYVDFSRCSVNGFIIIVETNESERRSNKIKASKERKTLLMIWSNKLFLIVTILFTSFLFCSQR